MAISTGHALVRYRCWHGAILVPGSNLEAPGAILVPGPLAACGWRPPSGGTQVAGRPSGGAQVEAALRRCAGARPSLRRRAGARPSWRRCSSHFFWFFFKICDCKMYYSEICDCDCYVIIWLWWPVLWERKKKENEKRMKMEKRGGNEKATFGHKGCYTDRY